MPDTVVAEVPESGVSPEEGEHPPRFTTTDRRQ